MTNLELLEGIWRLEHLWANNYSFLILDSQVIASFLADLYTVIGKNKELMVLLKYNSSTCKSYG